MISHQYRSRTGGRSATLMGGAKSPTTTPRRRPTVAPSSQAGNLALLVSVVL
jgi:hypothetical protein